MKYGNMRDGLALLHFWEKAERYLILRLIEGACLRSTGEPCQLMAENDSSWLLKDNSWRKTTHRDKA